MMPRSDQSVQAMLQCRHHQRCQRRFTRLASLARFVTAGSRHAAAGLLLALATLLVITPAQGNAQSATYRVTFEGKFTASTLASGVSVPSGDHFTTLIGAVHNGSATFWSSGGMAGADVEAVAELGTTDAFKSEINANMNVDTVFEQSIASGGTATATVDIVVTTAHPLVTLLTMIAPSPDWFVGVSGLSLLNAQNQWLSQQQVDLFPYDAGTEEGTEFSLTNAATSPQGTITNIKGRGKFSKQPIATLTFDLLGPAPRVPNIVIVLADDLGYGDVGYLNSQSQIPTPNLDTLAGEGMAFLDAHSPSAVCTPTRYGLLTGRYAWRTRLTRGVLNGYAGPLIAPNRETLGSFLGATGYRTAVIGKWHLGLGFAKNALGEFDFEEPIDDGPHTHGFDESYIIPASLDFPPYVYIRDGEITGFPLGQQPGMEFPRFMRAGELASDFDPADVLDELIRQATGFIQRQATDGSPFLLYLPLTAPHKPVWPAQRFEGTTELGPYGDFIVQVDVAVGDVMSALEQAGVDDNTLLIVTSDNGSFMPRRDGLDDRDHTDDSTIQAYRAGNHTANHVYRGIKADIWEGGHRVPFFARWPGEIEPGSTREEVISLTDVFATVAEIVGKELPNNAAEDSFSLLPLLRGKPWARPRAAVTHHSINGMFAIRDGRWKLVAGNGSGGREDPIGQPFERPYQLFDIASDPSEQSNVYDQHPAVAQRLERELERIRSWDRSRMTTDMAALVALYNGTNGANWKTNTNWLSEAPLVSLWDWHGVTTDQNGRVTELALASNDLSGTIPAELGERNLTKLQRLDLSENELSGAIPLTLMTLSQLSVLDIRSTTLCAPADTAFQAWLATINFQGAVCAAPPPPPPPPPPPAPPGNFPTADAGPDQTGVWEGALVTLDGSGSSDPDDDTLRYRWNQISGEPVVLSSQNIVNPTFTAPEGLTAEAVLQFRLLVTDPSGRFDSDTVTVTVDPEAEPPPAEVRTYYFPHLAVGDGWQTTITYINYFPEEVRCQTEFLSDQGTPLMVSFADQGTGVNRTDVLQPGESVHQETNVALSAPRVAGWAQAACTGPVKASLLYRRFEGGVPTGEAGVNATTVPATRFVTFAEQGEGKNGTGVAYANPSDTEADITFTVRDADGEVLASDDLMLSPNGHGAQNMVDLFDLTSFTGSLEVTSTEPIVSLSLNAEAAPVFSSLPPGELDADAQGTTTYYFPHLAVGAGWQTTITYINYSAQEVSCGTEFLSDDGAPLLVSFPERGTVVDRTDDLPPGWSIHEETNVELNAPLAPGWARATCSGPVKASLLYRRFEGGVPTGEAGVNATTVPATRFVTFAEQGEDQLGTGVAYANPSATSALVTFTARDADGETLASVVRTLLPGGHDAENMVDLFGLSSFSGWLEVTSTAPIVSLSLNNEADPVFSSLPPGELNAAAQ